MFLKKLFDTNARQLSIYKPVVDKINSLEDAYLGLSDNQLKDKTKEFQDLLFGKKEEEQTKILDQILPDAYALVREVAKRTIGLRHFDVQLLAGIALHQGKIAEQKTGEGKTLTATLPLYLNALTRKGVHLVTPNDYLSRHGAGVMGPVYAALGMSVGVIMQERAFIYDKSYENVEFNDEYTKHLREVSRREAYACDLTYGTNHEFGFDYLRDNMAYSVNRVVQVNGLGEWGVHNFALVDEVDSILIDFARTPLIISTTTSTPVTRYHQANTIVRQLIKDTDYEVEEKFERSTLTDFGIRKVEKLLGISNLYEQDFEMVHLIEQALRANTLFVKDKHYVVKEGQVLIVDQFTGRILPSNRFSQGLHQALEAKEDVPIKEESRTRAEISYQNYFRMYKKLAGMTGTAATESEEFYKIYGLDVVVIPTHRTLQRIDHNDIVYKTEAGKFTAVADEIVERSRAGQPVLVGTTSVEKSETLHQLLTRRGVAHQVLNAKNHEKEALIIAQAGRPGAVTISTNMAGRGVDILLGGDPSTDKERDQVKAAGGLHVIGTERHESRRIDNQLRGRSGRQGDPGSSRFYISLQDDLIRIFGGAQVESLMTRFGLDDSVPLEAKLVSKAIENAQKKVEGFNFDRRKNLVEMDDVINAHRSVIYKLRNKLLHIQTGNTESASWLQEKLIPYYDGDFPHFWDAQSERFGKENWLSGLSVLSLQVVDMLWMEHLVTMEHLREGIDLRGYAQKDPLVEYKKEGHAVFEQLLQAIYSSVVDRLEKTTSIERAQTSVATGDSAGNLAYEYTANEETGVSEESSLYSNVGSRRHELKDSYGRIVKVQKVSSNANKIGRNEPCPCGSGKKYKHCHGVS